MLLGSALMVQGGGIAGAQVVGSVAQGKNFSSGHTVDISSLDIQAGDVGFVFASTGGGSTPFISGYSRIAQVSQVPHVGAVFCREMGGSETSFDVSVGSGAAVFVLLRGYSVFTSAEVSSVSASDDPPSQMDPPAHSMAASSLSLVAVSPMANDISGVSAPSGYTIINGAAASINSIGAIVASKNSPDVSENPGVFTGFSGGWLAFTIEIMES